jgi:hypothetical protein
MKKRGRPKKNIMKKSQHWFYCYIVKVQNALDKLMFWKK